MTDEEFCNKANGKPWVNRGEDINTGMDCWGLVIASYKEIEGVELPQISGYNNADCPTEDAADEALKTRQFSASQAANGAIMVVEDNKGRITHVGRCLCGRVLHATKRLGTRLDSYNSINTQFKNVRYYKYAVN